MASIVLRRGGQAAHIRIYIRHRPLLRRLRVLLHGREHTMEGVAILKLAAVRDS